MKGAPSISFALRLAFSLLALCSASVHAQSQATDAQIEGVVTDANGSLIVNASITAKNTDTGTTRSATSNDSGIFRFPVLTLGTYTVTAEHTGFRKFERRGIELSAGQNAFVEISLETGDVSETVTVTSDVAIADASNTFNVRRITRREVHDLPLISRNPYNFVLLQPASTGRTVRDIAVVPLSVTGLNRRVGNQLDGGNDNDPDFAGFRLTFLSEVFVKEMQLLSGNYSAEFGNTAGAVVNVVTPSGTNDLNGFAGVLYRPAKLSARVFGATPSSPDQSVRGQGILASVGGPIIKDRWHFFGGYELTQKTTPNVISVSPANRSGLITAGLPSEIFDDIEGLGEDDWFLILRTDANITEKTRLSFRYNYFNGDLRNFGVGTLNTTQRSFDRTDANPAYAAQAVTTLSETLFNEFRFQHVRRRALITGNAYSGSGVAVNIPGAANFGRPVNLGDAPVDQSTTQLQNAVTKSFHAHLVKFGGSFSFFRMNPRITPASQYFFPNVAAYAMADSGENRRSYNRYQEWFGVERIPYHGHFINGFIQDEWKVSGRLKLSLGLRYDLYLPPMAVTDSPLPFSRHFTIDTNNFSPRIGAAYLLRDGEYRTVVRAGAGFYFDPPLLLTYSNAIRSNGSPRFSVFNLTPGQGGPNFPEILGSFPSGSDLRWDIAAVSPDFETMYAVHSNIQVEQALSDSLSVTAGYLYSLARHIPVAGNINCRPVGGTLADGRPLYGDILIAANGGVTVVPCTDRIYPQFQNISMTESVGNLAYHAFILQLNKRFSRGFQVSASYTYSRARDDAPEIIPSSDPSNRSRDRGPSNSDIPHVLRLSMVANPRFKIASRGLSALLNGNQIGLIVMADSGEAFNITTGDINRDGLPGATDRPVGIVRNAGRLPAFLNIDVRYSRFLKLREGLRLEIFGEAQNALNEKYVASYNGTILTSNNVNTSTVSAVTGELLRPLPDFTAAGTNWRRSREMQLGLKIHF